MSLSIKLRGDYTSGQGKALTNFTRTLPAPQSDLAQQVIKDPYNFEFLSLGAELRERELERGLLEHLRTLIMELGKGFAFVGNQYHLEVGGQDYYLDLLFYHLRLKLLPDAQEFALALGIMNSAAHGYDVDAAAAQEAFNSGKKFLAEVQKLFRTK